MPAYLNIRTTRGIQTVTECSSLWEAKKLAKEYNIPLTTLNENPTHISPLLAIAKPKTLVIELKTVDKASTTKTSFPFSKPGP